MKIVAGFRSADIAIERVQMSLVIEVLLHTYTVSVRPCCIPASSGRRQRENRPWRLRARAEWVPNTAF